MEVEHGASANTLSAIVSAFGTLLYPERCFVTTGRRDDVQDGQVSREGGMPEATAAVVDRFTGSESGRTPCARKGLTTEGLQQPTGYLRHLTKHLPGYKGSVLVTNGGSGGRNGYWGEGRILRLEIHPSRLLLRAQFLFHGLALMVPVYPLGIPLWLRIGLFTLMGFSLFSLSRNETLFRVHHLLLDGEGQWFRLGPDGKREALRLRGDSWLGGWLAVLRFEREQGRRPLNVVILPDNLDSHVFRRLRVRLRQASTGSGASSLPG